MAAAESFLRRLHNNFDVVAAMSSILELAIETLWKEGNGK